MHRSLAMLISEREPQCNHSSGYAKNRLPDVLTEAVYNLRWMLKMQDANDGGVLRQNGDAR